MNGEESGNETKENFKVEIQYEVSVQLLAFVCVNHYFHRLLTHAHPTFVYKLNIYNHKTVSNEKENE